MVGRRKQACDQIVNLANFAESESVQLQALRSVFSDVIAASRFWDLEHRMAEIEERLRELVVAIPAPPHLIERLGARGERSRRSLDEVGPRFREVMRPRRGSV